MRKLLLIGALLGSAVAAQEATAQAAGTKIAYIHSTRLFQEAPGATEVRNTLEKEMAKYRADLELLEDSIKNMVTDYQQKQVMLSPDAKKKQEDAIQAKDRALQQRQNQYQQTMQRRQEELVKPIMDRINALLEQTRKDGGYAILLDAAQGMIVASDTTLDLTDQILAKLKAGGATSAAAPKKPGN